MRSMQSMQGSPRRKKRSDLWAEPEACVVTLLATNRAGFLPVLDKIHATEVEGVSEAVAEHKGCIDTFCADHIVSSFGAPLRATGKGIQRLRHREQAAFRKRGDDRPFL
eukprot:gene28077-41046_t